MADKSVVDATLVGDSCDKTTADSDVTQALIDIEDIKKKLRVTQDVFFGGVAVENKMKETLKEYKNRFEELEEAWREDRKDLMRKSALVDEKEARLSR